MLFCRSPTFNFWNRAAWDSCNAGCLTQIICLSVSSSLKQITTRSAVIRHAQEKDRLAAMKASLPANVRPAGADAKYLVAYFLANRWTCGEAMSVEEPFRT